MNDIQLWFLILGVFLPRITILIAYCSSSIPLNSFPFIAEIIMAPFIPNILIAAYCYQHDQLIWMSIHIVVGILNLSSSKDNE